MLYNFGPPNRVRIGGRVEKTSTSLDTFEDLSPLNSCPSLVSISCHRTFPKKGAFSETSFPTAFNLRFTDVSPFFMECCPKPNMLAVKQPTNTPQIFVYWESKCGVGCKTGGWIIKTRLERSVAVLG